MEIGYGVFMVLALFIFQENISLKLNKFTLNIVGAQGFAPSFFTLYAISL
jgi:hypothetical protein